ncbi:MAG: hypothetical protein KJZ98_17910 [Burkholderiaceae bacterium]|nr:hypothetical protein [Burkholderiaceae bacterium]MEB2352342.1 hypothetical protein [Burkholderiaceae bacterium]
MTKSAGIEDPMELVGVPVPGGDSRTMAECLVEEYLLLGWDERQLMLLFSRPCFRVTHRIYLEKGEAYVQALIREVGARWAPDASCGEPLDA